MHVCMYVYTWQFNEEYDDQPPNLSMQYAPVLDIILMTDIGNIYIPSIYPIANICKVKKTPMKDETISGLPFL